MPDDSLRLPRVPNYRRSRSHLSKPLPPLPCDHVVASHSPAPFASSSRPPSGSAVLEQRAKAATNTAGPSIHVDPQNCTGSLGEPDDFGRQPSPVSLSVTAVDSDLAEMTIVPRSVAQHSARLPGFPSASDSAKLQQSPYKNAGMFNQAHNFTVTGTFVDGNVTYNNASSNQFMRELLGKTIPGAEFDSSDRDPPPRCHPGTRLAVLERCLSFISNCNSSVRKIRWVVGAAGVGKSAIMQSVAEAPDLAATYHASIFFSINGRSDGTKAVITLSYQFAAKSDSYRQVIEQKISRDPSLLRSSISKQFNKLIIEPFIHDHQLKSAGRVLIVIDGLDECNNLRTQQELLRLISDLCIMYPSSPLVWLIASRPEPHITSFFSRHNIIPVYEKEEIPVESNEARADVERFLRDKLTEIKESSDLLDSQWPDEQDIWKLADASGGLFAYAQTVIRYISDSTIGSPASQLSDVLRVIHQHPMTDALREEHPMALLDALYDRILSNIPPRIMINTRKLLLALSSEFSDTDENFIVLCNWLGLTPDEAYAALNHLRSVLYVPRRNKAHLSLPEPFHKSFIDYIRDFTRSGFSRDTNHEARQLKSQCAFRILKEAPDGINLGDVNYGFHYGTLLRGPEAGDKVSLTWLVGEADGWDDDETRLRMYKLAIREVVAGMGCGDPIFQSEFCIRLLTTRFHVYRDYFPYYVLRDQVFDESRRDEFMMRGILKEMPHEIVTRPDRYGQVKLQFRRPATTVTDIPNPWDSSCPHEREGEWQEGRDQDWKTVFWEVDCGCFARLRHQLANWKTQSPDHGVVILFTSTDEHCVELRIVDLEDGVSEWTYWFWFELSQEELGSLCCTE